MAGTNRSKTHKSSTPQRLQKPNRPTKRESSNGNQFLRKEIDNWMRPLPRAGDLVNAALKVAEERHRIELKMKDALIAGDDEQLKHFARLFLGIPQCDMETIDPKDSKPDKQ